ncbi:hypothetical protein BOTBODRAFT_104240 [Botryobasidium botryosum FD-172 SS1]|uniref:TauD/TfdA-like domain-containing protein n=1 Tax=Botryobasidium botryosum (strain FD-172 SS1) TaxID=930990 RepID=A0A067MUK0_BOTB1|nr:hypothetical protein BOTBODRAFT_104240 [Botryobasidium botryosum FD-172 SS1]
MQISRLVLGSALASARRSISTQRVTPTLGVSPSSAIITGLSASEPSEKYTFPYVWLRDSCMCPHCVHPSTRQKLHASSDVPLNVRPIPGEDGISLTEEGLRVRWREDSPNTKDIVTHDSIYPTEFLRRRASPSNLKAFNFYQPPVHWTASRIDNTPDLFMPYSDILSSPRALLTAISHLSQYGLLFITGVPNEETSHELCELNKLAELFSEIRETFYGRVWDVRSEVGSKNIAYTDLELGLHMDLLYFQHPPRYQFLHSLRNRSIKGGESFFSDAFSAATTLRRSHPAAFNLLASTPVPFHYINDGHHLHHAHPTMELDPHTPSQIAHINYSPPFQAPLPPSTPSEFYSALKLFSDLVNDPSALFQYTLKEGEAVIFDNRRVLHGRRAFSDAVEPSDGMQEVNANRWLKGCYVEADAILDRGRVLRRRLEKGEI